MVAGTLGVAGGGVVRLVVEEASSGIDSVRAPHRSIMGSRVLDEVCSPDHAIQTPAHLDNKLCYAKVTWVCYYPVACSDA